MISTQELLYELDQKLNKVSSLQNQYIGDGDKILKINEAAIKLVKTKADGIYGPGLDSSSKRYMDLQTLIVPFVSVSGISAGKDIAGFYSGNLPTGFFLPVSAYVVSSTNCCKERVVGVERMVPHADVPVFLRDPDWNPSFAYQLTIGSIEAGKVKVYSENLFDKDDSFQVDEIHVSYLQLPQKADVAGYIRLDGTASTDQDINLPEHLKDELLNMTLIELGLNTGNLTTAQAGMNQLKTSE